MTAGFSPVHSLTEGLTQVHTQCNVVLVAMQDPLSCPLLPPFAYPAQVLLMSPVRLLSFFYIASFNKIVRTHLNKPAPENTTTHPH